MSPRPSIATAAAAIPSRRSVGRRPSYIPRSSRVGGGGPNNMNNFRRRRRVGGRRDDGDDRMPSAYIPNAARRGIGRYRKQHQLPRVVGRPQHRGSRLRAGRSSSPNTPTSAINNALMDRMMDRRKSASSSDENDYQIPLSYQTGQEQQQQQPDHHHHPHYHGRIYNDHQHHHHQPHGSSSSPSSSIWISRNQLNVHLLKAINTFHLKELEASSSSEESDDDGKTLIRKTLPKSFYDVPTALASITTPTTTTNKNESYSSTIPVLQATEEQSVKICQLLKQLVLSQPSSNSGPPMMSFSNDPSSFQQNNRITSSPEYYLDAWIRFRKLRSGIVYMTLKQEQDEEGANGWTTWIKSLFLATTNDDTDDTNDKEVVIWMKQRCKELGLFVHADKSLSPSERIFRSCFNQMLERQTLLCPHPSNKNTLERTNDHVNMAINITNTMITFMNKIMVMELGLYPTSHIIGTVIRSHEVIGKLSYARQAAQIYYSHYFGGGNNNEGNVGSSDGSTSSIGSSSSSYCLYWTLRCYKAAILSEFDVNERMKGIDEMTNIMKQSNNAAAAAAHQNSKARKNQITGWSLVLQTLTSAGSKVIPDGSPRAYKIGQEIFGKEFMKELLENPMAAAASAQTRNKLLQRHGFDDDDLRILHPAILHYLICIFALGEDNTTGERDWLADAKMLLHQLESIRHAGSDYPSVDTYEGMMKGISWRCIKNLNSLHPSKRYATGMDLGMALYCTSLLDSMISASASSSQSLSSSPSSSCWPRMSTLRELLHSWVKVQHVESGPCAQSILDRFIMRQSTMDSSNLKVTAEECSFVLRCWKNSASRGHPDAANGANRLLRQMEVVSGIESYPTLFMSTTSPTTLDHDSPSSSNNNNMEEMNNNTTNNMMHPDDYKSLQVAYKPEMRPETQHYNMVLRACQQTRNTTNSSTSRKKTNRRMSSSSENNNNAMNVAKDVYSRMKRNNNGTTIEPNGETFALLWKCVHYLIPRASSQRRQLAQQYHNDALKWNPNFAKEEETLYRLYKRAMNLEMSSREEQVINQPPVVEVEDDEYDSDSTDDDDDAAADDATDETAGKGNVAQ